VPRPPFPIIVIVTALEIETRAVLRQLGKHTVETVNGTGFFKGHFEGWDVAVVEAGPGNAGAAAIAVRAIEHYKPGVTLFVGVAVGVKDVAIGDVVVATKVYGYESGKDTRFEFTASRVRGESSGEQRLVAHCFRS
jgi:nucleoside phosphorylase